MQIIEGSQHLKKEREIRWIKKYPYVYFIHCKKKKMFPPVTLWFVGHILLIVNKID